MNRRDFITGSVVVGASATVAAFTYTEIKANQDELAAKSLQRFSSSSTALPVVFPIPEKLELQEPSLFLNDSVVICVPSKTSANDLFLARMLQGELIERFRIALPIRSSQPIAGQKCIVIGSAHSLIVNWAAAELQVVTPRQPESYVVVVEKDIALVAGSDDAGAFYGLQTLRQLLAIENSRPAIRGAIIQDSPYEAFRGVRLFLPGPENVAFFKRFIRDFMALYKFNRLIVEMNATMRLNRHPELNAGSLEFARAINYSRRDRPAGPGNQFQDSSHHDTADGLLLEKEQVAELADYARQHHIEVIPEIPSLTHSYYLLTRHRELAEIQAAEWPDTYCPADPRSRQLLFDVMDEYLEVLKPRMVHIGHDEWRMPVGVCSRCRGRDVRDLFVEDVREIHQYLTRRGVKVAMWGDHLLEAVAGKGLQKSKTRTGYAYEHPGALTPEHVRQIPKDILVFNWFWADEPNRPGEPNDAQLEQFGFQQVYGNMTPLIRDQNYPRRSRSTAVMGGAASSWAATTEFNFGKDLLYDLLGTANLLWSRHWPEDAALTEIIQQLIPTVRANLRGRLPPSETENEIKIVDISGVCVPTPSIDALDQMDFNSGLVKNSKQMFELISPTSNGGRHLIVSSSNSSKAVALDIDPSSLIFLHASARPATNEMAFRMPHNTSDTSALLGWYEVVYQDGLPLTIPIRYGVNILEWDWRRRKTEGRYCYGADAVEISKYPEKPVTFFALEWVNPRLGKSIKEVRLHGNSAFQTLDGRFASANTILWAALSLVEKRKIAAVPTPGL